MKKQLVYLFVVLFTAGLSACDETERFETRSLSIRLAFPEGFDDLRRDSISIQITNQSIGTVYTLYTDTSGCARADLTAGTLQINIQQTNRKGYVDYLLHGGYSTLYFEMDDKELQLDIDMEVSEASRLLIEELYFNGCLRSDGKTTYVKDQYITLANNSKETIYLDGLCIGQVAPATTANPSGWMLHTDMKELPLFMMCWQFPGNGTDYPLLPGKRQVIATQAIDHTAGETGVPASVDLSKADWAFWNPSLTGSQISIGVKPLNLLWRSGGSSYAFTTTGPTVILFLPDVDMKTYVADASHLRPEPGSISKMLYLHIPTRWLQDAANFVSSVTTQANTRLPLTLDVSPGIADRQSSGMAFQRVIHRGQWKDTNNTQYDFDACQPSMR